MIKQLSKKVLQHLNLTDFVKNSGFIFVYHDVSEPVSLHHSTQYSTNPVLFEKHLDYFQSVFRMVSLEELIQGDLDPDYNYASITFDDGFRSVYTHAHPILNKRNIPYSVFVNGCAVKFNQNWISNTVIYGDRYKNKICGLAKVKSEPDNAVADIMERGVFDSKFESGYLEMDKSQNRIYLNEDELKNLHKDGVLIGNHSEDHFVLSKCERDLLISQIEKTEILLNSITQASQSYLALPFGKKEHYNKKVIEALEKKNYKFILTTNPNKISLRAFKNKLPLIPRIGLSNQTLGELKFYVNRTFLRSYTI